MGSRETSWFCFPAMENKTNCFPMLDMRWLIANEARGAELAITNLIQQVWME